VPYTCTGKAFSTGVVADHDGIILANLLQDGLSAVRTSLSDGVDTVASILVLHQPCLVNGDETLVTLHMDLVALSDALAGNPPREIVDALTTALASWPTQEVTTTDSAPAHAAHTPVTAITISATDGTHTVSMQLDLYAHYHVNSTQCTGPTMDSRALAAALERNPPREIIDALGALMAAFASTPTVTASVATETLATVYTGKIHEEGILTDKEGKRICNLYDANARAIIYTATDGIEIVKTIRIHGLDEKGEGELQVLADNPPQEVIDQLDEMLQAQRMNALIRDTRRATYP
jgi:hypothetical protein